MELLVNNILTRGFWGDEAWTALISQLPLLDLVKTTAADFHPPFYYSIIHYWILFFGSGEVTIRLVSLLFWLLAGLVAWFFARSLKLPAVYRWAVATFVLFNPFVFQYAFEARNYTLFVCMSLASMWWFYEILKAKRPGFLHSALYILLTALGLYTHYYMFFVVGTQYLFMLIFRRDLFKKFFIYGLLLFILYLPWLPFFLSQAKSVAGGYWIAPISWSTIAGGALVLILGEQNNIVTYGLAAVFVSFVIVAGKVASQEKRLLTWQTAMFVFWLAVPFVTPVIISLVRPIFFYRYLIFLAVPVMIGPLYWLAGRKIVRASLWWAVAVLLLFVLLDGINFVTSTDQHFKPVLAHIHQVAQKGDVIYTVLPSFAEVVYYNNYDGHPLTVKVLPAGLNQASGKALLDTYVRKNYLTLENFPSSGRYWYLQPGPKYQLVDSH